MLKIKFNTSWISDIVSACRTQDCSAGTPSSHPFLLKSNVESRNLTYHQGHTLKRTVPQVSAVQQSVLFQLPRKNSSEDATVKDPLYLQSKLAKYHRLNID